MDEDKAKIIAMLNRDIEGEHMAIVQYLHHAYALGEGEMACEIEAIAREEMYHFRWLAETIVSLGGELSLSRQPLDIGGPARADMLRRDVKAEQDAIDLYRTHLEAIQDEKIRLLLERIISDEEAHKAQFSHFIEKLQAEGVAEEEVALGQLPLEEKQRTLDILNAGVRHEYTVILQYLYHAFTTPQCPITREMEMQAINEMQHLGWLAEEVAALGGSPDIERDKVDTSKDTAKMLEADIAAERAVTADYGKQIEEIEDEELKELLTRIRSHEIYHDKVFSEMLRKLRQGEKPPAPGPLGKLTVGSLLGQKQD